MQTVRKIDSDVNAGGRVMTIPANQLRFLVRPTVDDDGGRKTPRRVRGSIVHKDATGRRFILV